MRVYKKAKTLIEIIRLLRNWPSMIMMRLFKKQVGLRLLDFRDGLYLLIRPETYEWELIKELLFSGGYGKALSWLSARKDANPIVIDIGGNIGLFSLMALRSHPGARVITFEPGPPNIRLFQLNMLANDVPPSRINLRQQAVAGTAGEAVWYFDAGNPAASSFYGDKGAPGLTVHIQAFTQIVEEHAGDIALVKIDIEGGEYDILEHTPASTWNRIQAVALELHPDPSGKNTPALFLQRMKAFGYQVEEESTCSLFLHR